ncbi:MAG: VanZ family protein [Chitinophagaceae bacterium]|nr:VanZ family protein [Chitinophagaceae bacterium]
MKPALFIPAIIYLIISALLLCMPGNDLPRYWLFEKIPHFDKMVHIGMFGLLCLLFSIPAWKSTLSNRRKHYWYWTVALLAMGYGIGMEFIQLYFIPFRSFDEADILSDMVGSLGALALAETFFISRKA